MARRGSNSFKRNDAIRAIKSARDAGIEPSMMEVVVTTDEGTVTFRVYGEKAAGLMGMSTETSAAAREWEDEIEKLKTKPKSKD
jgi:hypothetical protein